MIRSFRRIAIDPNLEKSGCDAAVRLLAQWLDERGLVVLVPPEVRPALPRARVVPRGDLAREADLVIALGGDGTLLSAARRVHPNRVPILGVNFGGLGFLTDVTIEEMLPAIEQVLRGDSRSELRVMLEARVSAPGGTVLERRFAVNDVVLHDAGHRILTLLPEFAGTSMGPLKGDGLIIASPTGSTAYSLSAGGPIVEPKLRALIATPICPHLLSWRPIVFSADQMLVVRVPESETQVELVADGQDALDVAPGGIVEVGCAEEPIEFLLVQPRTYYDVLRTKLKWGG
jgi:NAD+ kinase